MIPTPILDAALAAYARTPGTSRVAMEKALEAAFAAAKEQSLKDATPEGFGRSPIEAIWPLLESRR